MCELQNVTDDELHWLAVFREGGVKGPLLGYILYSAFFNVPIFLTYFRLIEVIFSSYIFSLYFLPYEFVVLPLGNNYVTVGHTECDGLCLSGCWLLQLLLIHISTLINVRGMMKIFRRQRFSACIPLR